MRSARIATALQAANGSLLNSVGLTALSAHGDSAKPGGLGHDRQGRDRSAREADGSWVNVDSKEWWEDKPELVTSWSLIALEHALK